MVNFPLKFTHVGLATLTKIPPHTAPSTDENGMLSSHLMRKFEGNQLKEGVFEPLLDFCDGSWKSLFPWGGIGGGILRFPWMDTVKWTIVSLVDFVDLKFWDTNMQPAFLKQTQRRSIAAPTGCFVLVHPKNGKKESLVVERVVQIVCHPCHCLRIAIVRNEKSFFERGMHSRLVHLPKGISCC